ncbi:MAG TPA: FAD-dependent oxidoreductase [Polyangia bacterium]|jgi:flavin-dependent dehydrogenase
MRTYDVVIVGAGPGGLECAWGLKESGLHVLVLEKNATVGPKACAGAVTALAAVDLPAERCRTFTDEHYTIGSREYVVPLTRPLQTVDRGDLGRHQLGRLGGHANIEVLTATRVLAAGCSGSMPACPAVARSSGSTWRSGASGPAGAELGASTR